MSWYNEKGDMQDVVLSTRVRLARNLRDYPFVSRLTDKQADEIINKVCSALPDYGCEKYFEGNGYKCRSQMEMHYVSPEFVSAENHRALLSGEGDKVKIMVCEEDHLRIQSILPGFNPKEAFEYASKADDILSSALDIAFSEKYGYLTQCPTNLGAAMRVSAMLCLPALTMQGVIESYANAVAKMGITIRGMYGEGSRASGCIYQISNKASLGMGESEIIKLISDAVNKLVQAERNARKSVYESDRAKLTDKVARSVGLLKYANLISSDEFGEVFSDLKLGISLGITEGLSDVKLSEMLIAVQPATLYMTAQGMDDGKARDKARAGFLRNMMKDVKVVGY